ncbi:UNVERIFIED_CONTAM: hypothetical protein GTU68_035933 [Idotea baltica]|nr:hypothetical protein [Idotea baltica]
MNDNDFIRETFKLARSAVNNGNNPFGAILTKDGVVIERAENTVNTSSDCTAHAEINLIRRAQTKLKTKDLTGYTLYASSEPCTMCAGAVYWANIDKVVFSCSTEKLREIAGKTIESDINNLLSDTSNNIEIMGPLLEDEGVEIHKEFWSK